MEGTAEPAQGFSFRPACKLLGRKAPWSSWSTGEKLARLHFSLDVCGEEAEEEDGVTEGLPEEQKEMVADHNLGQLLSNPEEFSNSVQKLHLAEC